MTKSLVGYVCPCKWEAERLSGGRVVTHDLFLDRFFYSKLEDGNLVPSMPEGCLGLLCADDQGKLTIEPPERIEDVWTPQSSKGV